MASISSASATARRARSTLTAWMAVARAAPRRTASVCWPELLEPRVEGRGPGPGGAWRGPAGAATSRSTTSGSGTSRSTSSARASPTLSRSAIWACILRTVVMRVGAGRPRSSSSVSNSEASAAHSSVTSGRTRSLTSLSGDLEVQGLVLVVVGVRRRRTTRSSPALAPRQLLVELGHDACRCRPRRSSPRRSARRAARRPGCPSTSMVTTSPSAAAPLDRLELGVLAAQPVDLGVDLLVGGGRPAGS